jgi:anthranilate phosphoribosyltransferase
VASVDVGAILERLCGRQGLAQEESWRLFGAVVRGEIGEAALAALLVALKSKGETPDEIAGAARAMREAAVRLDTGGLAVADSCGTGGDGAGTLNISTAVALVAAEAGVHVAKHGNRSVSSRCGSADVLGALGIATEAPPELSRRCLAEERICFLFAPQYHAGVRHAMPVRRALGVRTIFNLLGPLANPAWPRWQLVGVYDAARCRVLAETLALLGCERALVVHGGGLDEIALHAPTHAALLERGTVRELAISPEDAGLERRPLAELAGGEPAENAARLRAILEGRGSAAERDAVALNAGALLWVCGVVPDLRAGVAESAAILASRRSAERLDRWKGILDGA